MKVIEINECPECPFCSSTSYSLLCGFIGQLYNVDIESKVIPKNCPLKEHKPQQQYDYHDSQFN